MIISFRHKGLKRFFESGSTSGINPAHAARLGGMLLFLDRAISVDELDLPGWRLHRLRGKYQGHWSLTVSGNWRLVFQFTDAGVEVLDYLDYH